MCTAIHRLVFCWLIYLGCFLMSPLTWSATFVVNNYSSGTPDLSPGDGLCVGSDGTCGVLTAIEESNALSGQDTIFISTSYSSLIEVKDDLPSILDNLTIQGENETLLLKISAWTHPLQIGDQSHLVQVTFKKLILTGSGSSSFLYVAPESSLALQSVTLSSNGGDVLIKNAGELTITDSSFVNNGLDLLSVAGGVKITDSTFIGNAPYPLLDSEKVCGTLQFINSNVTLNQVSVAHKQIEPTDLNYTGGGALCFVSDDQKSHQGILDHVTLDQNILGSMYQVAKGAGIYNDGYDLTVTNSTIKNNRAFGGGAGLYNQAGTVKLVHCQIQNNLTEYDGDEVNCLGDGIVSNDQSSCK